MAQHKAGLIQEFIMRYITSTFVALLIVVSGGVTFYPEQAAFGAAETRIVHFPADRSLGILYTRDSGVEGRKSWQGWEELGQARGEISISHGKELRLMISDSNYESISHLASLGANDIQNLYIRCRHLQDSDMVHLKGLTGLESLGLSSGRSSYTCPLTGTGFIYLRDMSLLRNLVVQFTMIDDESLGHLKNLTSLENLTLWNNMAISGEGLVHLRNMPSLRYISFYTVPIEDFGLENLKGMSRLEHLSLQYTHVTDDGLVHLKGLTGLKDLVLPPNTTDTGLVNLSGLSSLERLYISDTKVTDDGLAYLKGLSGLKSLTLGGRNISGTGLKHLHDMPRLKDVSIKMDKMDDEGMRDLKGLTSVTSLNLERTQVSDAGLANIEGLTALEYLNLGSVAVTDTGLVYLKDLTSLEGLRLEGTLITDAGMANLQNLASLQTLWLQGTDITDAGLAYLKGLQSLNELYLSHTQVSDAGLVNLKELHSLQYVFLDGTNVSGEGLVHLKDLKSLRTLVICVNSLSEVGVGHLKEMTWLHELSLGEGSVSEAAIAELKKALPDCVINLEQIPPRQPKPRPIPISLSGRPLPGLKDLGIDLSPAKTDDKMILVCFFDMQQRPSRNCIAQLVKRAEQLQEKSVVVAAVQASNVDQKKLDQWVKQNDIPFPIGMINGDAESTKLTWGVKSLPWLILTDREHIIIRAEDFGLDELDKKLSETADIDYMNTQSAAESASTSQSSSRQIKVVGVARDRDGKPVAGVEVQRLHGPGPVKTDAEGKFELLWDPERNRPLVDTYYIIARHERENLSVVVEVPEFEQGAESVNLNLLPGVTFKGKVIDPAGRAIELARVSILLHTPTQGSGLYHKITDSEGMFEFRGIPTDHKYTFAADASGHGTKWVHNIYAGHDYARKEFMLEPMTLAIADQSVSGVVVDANDKPISGVRLSTDGQGQPQHYNVRTDAEGKFTIDEVCTGNLRIYATVRGETLLSGYARTYGGATDVRIVLKEVPFPQRRRNVPKTPPSLVGRALPEVKDLGIELSSAQIGGKPVLLCFFDLEQRPSRYFVTQLAKRAGQLKNKGLAVIIVHASKVEKSRLDEWIKDNNILFQIGMTQGDATKTRFTWGIKSLPWLILTDRSHVVVAEGFGLSKLDDKIKEIKPSTSAPVELNKVTGLVEDSQGRLLSGVRVTEYQTDKDYTTDADGRFVSAFGPSGERRVFFAVDKVHKLVGVRRLQPEERHVEIKLIPGKMVSGTVVDPAGRPVAGAQVVPLPMTCYHVLTDEQGRFDVGWAPKWAGNLDTFFLMARHLKLNLAGGIEIDSATKNVRINLEPALILAGTVEDPNGVPIPGAKVGLSLRRGWACGTPVRKVVADEYGGYEFPVLPQKQEYINYADAEGFWQNQITTGIINRKVGLEQVGPVILKRPVLSVSGTVLYGNKVVAGIPVYLGGKGQPKLEVKTGAGGKFVFEKVCCGPVWISAKNDTLFGKIETEGGASNLKLVVRPRFE